MAPLLSFPRVSERTERSTPADPSLLTAELMARVRQIQIRTHRVVSTALSGGYRSTFRGTGLEFQEVRAYQPGDDVRRIDWNVTARTGEAFVKSYAEERELCVHLIVDQSRSMDFGSRQWTKRESAAQFCALMSFAALQTQDRVGLSLFGEKPGLRLPSRKGGQHVLRVVREVIAAVPSAGGSDIAAVLEQEERVLRRRGIVFLISDFLTTPALANEKHEPWTEILSRLALRHDVIAVRVHDPLESALPPVGRIDLAELEGGARGELDLRSRGVREAWSAAALARRKALVDDLLRAQVELIEVDASKDAGESVVAFFRRRALRTKGVR